jgi:U3 small nucleolar RNA-associated protein 22
VKIVFGVQYDITSRNNVESNTGWIPSARLFPNRCNNKIVHLPGQGTITTNNNGTPNYNNALSSDMHHLSTTHILSSVSLSALKIFTETWVLLKIWCLQRGFLRGHDTFSEKSLGLSLAYLYRSKLVSTRMDSIQVFTVWMKFMSDTDWLGDNDVSSKKKTSNVNKDNIRYSSSQGYQDLGISSTRGRKWRGGVVMPEMNMSEQQTVLNCVQNRLHASDVNQNSGDKDDANRPKTLLESYKMNTDSPIFLDPTMTVNYFGNISPSFIQDVQIDAKNALQEIHFHGDSFGSRIESFRQLFLEQQRFWRRYDAYLKVDINDIVFPKKSESKSKREEINFWGDDVQDLGNYEAISRGLSRLLNMGLGDRITGLRLLTTGNGDTTTSFNVSAGDIGTTPITDGDNIVCVPIRSTSASSYTGFSLDSTKSPVTDGACHARIIVVGFRINPDTCHRIVDRGPPADDTMSSNTFVSLWGERKAELRRFKDGAIIHAVVWNDIENDSKRGRVQHEGDAKVGDIVERIARHIFRKHFCKEDIKELPCPQFSLRNMASLVEAAQQDGSQMKSSEQAHKNIMSAFDSLVQFLRRNTEISTTPSGESVSKLGLPLRIDAVEALSPCLRYAEVFPPLPHALLGGKKDSTSNKKVSGVIVGDPILIQIRFQGSAKWPQDINAMGAAKCAMLMQLAEGIEELKSGGDRNCAQFDGPINVMPTYLDLGYSGYTFRIIVRADEELKMINSLRNPSQEAITLKQVRLLPYI